MENSVSNNLRSTFFDCINVFDCRLFEVFIEYTEYVVKTIRNKGYRNNLHFSCFCRKNNFVSTPEWRQKKRLFTMDERGSEIATTSVFDCHLSPVGRLIAIENSVSNYFGLRSSIVLTFLIAAYPVCFRCTFHDVTVDISAYN